MFCFFLYKLTTDKWFHITKSINHTISLDPHVNRMKIYYTKGYIDVMRRRFADDV